MNQTDIIDFFDKMAEHWDEQTIRRESAICDILDKGGVVSGAKVLDIGCGTGVLFADYIKRDVASVLGVDISKDMLKHAKANYNDSRITLLCENAETMVLDEKFDCIMVHNAFPHFMHPEMLLKNLSSFLAPNGRLTVAHSLSRAEIDKCHEGKAHSISLKLPSETELASLFQKFVTVDVAISDDEKYIVSGYKTP